MAEDLGLGVVADVSLSIQIIHDRRQARLVPIGELDAHSASTFAVAGELAITEHPEHLHVDLSQITFIDSSGVRSIEALMAMAEAEGIGCTVRGPATSDGKTPTDEEAITVWSGSTVHRVERPEQA